MNEDAKELLTSLASIHNVPIELTEDMAALMAKYPDLSQWGSRPELKRELEKIINSAFTNKLVSME